MFKSIALRRLRFGLFGKECNTIRNLFMNRFGAGRFVLVLASLLTIVFVGSPLQAGDKPIELTYATYLPETALHTVQELLWASELEKRSNGRVKVVRRHFGGAIAGSGEQLESIASGLIDVGFGAAFYNAAQLRLATLSGMIYVTDVSGADIRARVELYETFPDFRKEMRAAGVELMTIHPTASAAMCISKRRMINSTADLVGIKSQVPGSIEEVMRKVGMVPVGMPIREAYEAMSRGVIDGLIAPAWYLVPSKLYEVVGTIIDPGIGSYACVFLNMNKDRYDSLPDDIKQIIKDLRRDLIIPETKLLEDLEEDALKKLKEVAPNLKFVQLSEKAKSQWKEKTNIDALYDKYIKERESRSPRAREFLQKYIELSKKYEPEMRKYYKSPFEKVQVKVID